MLLVHYGMTEEDFFTVMFGVGRAIGVSNLISSSLLLSSLELSDTKVYEP